MRLVVLVLLALSARAVADPNDFVLPSGEVIPGAPLDEIPPLSSQVTRLREATKSALGVDIGPVSASLVTMDELNALHQELGGQLPHGFSLFGFELRGHVFVRRALAGVPDDVVVHESLHALSEKFNGQAHAEGIAKMIEGITQYLTLEALDARPSDPRRHVTKNHTYIAYTDFADTLATLVGEQRLRDAYFGGGFPQLAQRVDAVTHARRTLVRAAHALEASDERASLRILTTGR